MTISEKQLEANRENAQKGGVKTPEGKAIVKHNALKHGLLAKEIVITAGDAIENQEEFNALLEDLNTQLKPVGVLEEILVEKIAVAYWRLRRAYRYEVGVIRKELDDAISNHYEKTDSSGHKLNMTNEQIEWSTQQDQESLEGWEEDKEKLTNLYKAGKPLEEIYDWIDSWDSLFEVHYKLFPSEDEQRVWTPKDIREFLNNNAKWSDDRIWQAHIWNCTRAIKEHKERIASLEKQKVKNTLKLQVVQKLGCMLSKDELERLLRYEGAIERQLYKAMNQLERLQRLRLGDYVPAPATLDVDVNTGHNG